MNTFCFKVPMPNVLQVALVVLVAIATVATNYGALYAKSNDDKRTEIASGDTHLVCGDFALSGLVVASLPINNEKELAVYRDPISLPCEFPLGKSFTFLDEGVREKMLNSLQWGALGDAWGNPVEFAVYRFKSNIFDNGVKRIQSSKGLIEELKRLKRLDCLADGKLIQTDDTVMTEITLAALILHAQHDKEFGRCDEFMERLAHAININYEMRNTAGSYSWADAKRAPGLQCMKAADQFSVHLAEKDFSWDRTKSGLHQRGFEGGCGRIMAASAFGMFFYKSPALAGRLAAQHSKISHADVVSQVACDVYAYGIARALSGEDLSVTVADMISAAEKKSQVLKVEEKIEWDACPYKPHGMEHQQKPYTVADRLKDACIAVSSATSIGDAHRFYAQNTGMGAPDFVASVVFTALYAQKYRLTMTGVCDIILHTPAKIDRDSLLSGALRFLAFFDFPSGSCNLSAESQGLERSNDRAVFNEYVIGEILRADPPK